MIHPSIFIQFFIICYSVIEFRPYGDHESSIHGMHAVQHSLRIRITRSLKSMISPAVQFPIVPVLHDIIYRNMAVTESLERRLYLLTTLVAFTTLPEAERPFRIHLCLPGKSAIAGDYLVKIITGYKIIVQVFRHFIPNAQLSLFLFATGCCDTESTI